MAAAWAALGAGWRRAGAWLDRSPWTVTVLVTLLALAPRLAVATEWAREPVWDGHYYHFGAQRIAEGVGYGDQQGGVFRPWCHYPVGYSGFLAGFYALFGATPAVATAVQALIGAATVAAVHRLALSFLSPLRALLAALLCAASPNLILYSGLVMTEPLAGLGLLLAPLVFGRLRDRPLLAALAAGAVLGLTTLVRPQSILFAPALALLCLPGTAFGKRLVIGALALGSCALVVSPWTLRNCQQMDGCAFVSTNAGWNLAIGSSPRATGRFEALSGQDGCGDVTGQVDQDRCFARRGAAWIREDPGRWVALAPAKLGYTFDHQSFAVGYLAQADPGHWPEARRSRYRILMTAAQYALVFLASLGALLLPRARASDIGLTAAFALAPVLLMDGIARAGPQIWPLALLLPLFTILPPLGRASGARIEYLAWCFATLILVHVVFFGEDRYQIVVTPALCILAAAALRKRPDNGLPCSAS